MASIEDRTTNPDSLTTPGHPFRCGCEKCRSLRKDRWAGLDGYLIEGHSFRCQCLECEHVRRHGWAAPVHLESCDMGEDCPC